MSILRKTSNIFLFFLSLLVLFSCNNGQKNNSTESADIQDAFDPWSETRIADLPDSLQPRIIALDTMPRPLEVVVPNKTRGAYSITNSSGDMVTIPLEPPVAVSLPLLRNEEGEPILDARGMPLIMGDGGRSHFTTFTTDQGLALDGIGCAVMDKAGNLWFGTLGGGVSRYDGKSFVNFTTAHGLANNGVMCLLQDAAGNMWFGTFGGGVSRYDGTSFANFTTTEGLANNNVRSILQDKTGIIWFGTEGGGVSRYDGRSFKSFTTDHGLANNNVRCILEDKDGNLWFGTEGGGVSRYDGRSFKNFTTAHGLANNAVWSIAQDKEGTLWFGTGGGGVSRYDGRSFTNFTTAHGLADNNVKSILEDISGSIWFGTLGGGVSRYDGRSFTVYTTAQGLANDRVMCILEDRSGNLWFGTGGGGVSRYDGRSFLNFTTAQGLAINSVRSIIEDKTGTLWFATDGGGVYRYDGRSFLSFTTAQGLVNNSVWSILEDKMGNLWFATIGGGVCRYDGRSFLHYTTDQGLASNSVWSMLEDKAGNLWFGTDGGGVCRYDGSSFLHITTAQGLANNSVLSMLEDKAGHLWFGTLGGGVSCYDGRSFIHFTTAQGLANNTIWSICEDTDGNLWFGTDAGISILDAELMREIFSVKNHGTAIVNNNSKVNSSERMFKNFTIQDGLPDNFITQVIQLPGGKIAVGSNLGITLFNISNDLSKLTDVEVFNSNTGYPVKDVNVGQQCMLLDSKGVLWAGTGSQNSGLVRFDYTELHKHKAAPAVAIQSIKVKEENICWFNLQTKGIRRNHEDSATAVLQELFAYGRTRTSSENDAMIRRFGNIQFDGITKNYPLPENLVLPYEHNQISFEFAAIETNKPLLVKYQFILEGYDKDWSPVTNRNNATFGNIKEGSYTFKLKAQADNGVWTEPVVYSFRVLPPWYRTWWAYLIYGLLFTFVISVVIKWRERKLRTEKERLEKTVELRTMEVVKEKKEAEWQRQRSDELLLNILPEVVAEELKIKGTAEARHFDQVTVLFTDFKGFTQFSEKLTPAELVAEINTCFSAFDRIMDKYGIEKIKTIGDAYMAAGGLSDSSKTPAEDVIRACLEIQQFMAEYRLKKEATGDMFFEIRIGVHTGPVVAGIVGFKKFAYDIWGDTVNIASRMESSGEVGKVNISETTYELIRDKFKCTYRGNIQAKGKGEMAMYFLEGRIA